MIVALDVHYSENHSTGAAVTFEDSRTDAVRGEYLVHMPGPPAEYVPGEFYRRELPVLLALFELVRSADARAVRAVLVDGYVDTGPGHPGLGRRLHDALPDPKPAVVIGVAKTHFHGAEEVAVLRGASRTPLYVTALGIDSMAAGDVVRAMHGDFRVPTLLKRVDALTRRGSCRLDSAWSGICPHGTRGCDVEHPTDRVTSLVLR